MEIYYGLVSSIWQMTSMHGDQYVGYSTLKRYAVLLQCTTMSHAGLQVLISQQNKPVSPGCTAASKFALRQYLPCVLQHEVYCIPRASPVKRHAGAPVTVIVHNLQHIRVKKNEMNVFVFILLFASLFIYYSSLNVRSSVVMRLTAGQQAGRSILHQGNDSYQKSSHMPRFFQAVQSCSA